MDKLAEIANSKLDYYLFHDYDSGRFVIVASDCIIVAEDYKLYTTVNVFSV